MKTRTCLQCKGKGLKSTPVVHLGVPGLCYGCDGRGTQKWVTKDEINEGRARQWDNHFRELRIEGEAFSDAHAFYALFLDWLPEGGREDLTAGQRRYKRRLRSEHVSTGKMLEHTRKRWTESKRAQREEKKAKQGKWVSLATKF